MQITRRDFLRYAAASAAVLGVSGSELAHLERVLADASSPPVIWLAGACCSGCSVSLLNAVNPTIDQVLLNTISLKYHPTVMSAAGDLAVQAARSAQKAGGYVLAIEGAIPTASGGSYCYVWDEGGKSVTMAAAVQSLAASAKYIVAIGTCAAFGGIPGKYAAAGAKGVSSFLGRPVVNLPGCPSHPDWIVGTLVQVLSGKVPALDSNGRPTMYYGHEPIHDRCPREDDEEDQVRTGVQLAAFGQDGRCLKPLGCKGPDSHCDCDIRGWNNNQGYCIGVNGLCIGCTEPDFPAFPLHTSIAVGPGVRPGIEGPTKIGLPLIGRGG